MSNHQLLFNPSCGIFLKAYFPNHLSISRLLADISYPPFLSGACISHITKCTLNHQRQRTHTIYDEWSMFQDNAALTRQLDFCRQVCKSARTKLQIHYDWETSDEECWTQFQSELITPRFHLTADLISLLFVFDACRNSTIISSRMCCFLHTSSTDFFFFHFSYCLIPNIRILNVLKSLDSKDSLW